MTGSLSGVMGMLLPLAVYIIWRAVHDRRKIREGYELSAMHEAMCLLLALYLFGLASVSFLPADLSMLGTGVYPVSVDPMPFNTLTNLGSQVPAGLASLFDYAIPFLAYLPLGALLPLVFEHMAAYRRTISVSLLIAIGVELLQLLETFLGISVKAFTLDGVIFGAIGATLGYGVFLIVRSVIRRYRPDYRRIDLYEYEDDAQDHADEGDGGVAGVVDDEGTQVDELIAAEGLGDALSPLALDDVAFGVDAESLGDFAPLDDSEPLDDLAPDSKSAAVPSSLA